MTPICDNLGRQLLRVGRWGGTNSVSVGDKLIFMSFEVAVNPSTDMVTHV